MKQLKILILEDNLADAERIQLLLTAAGYLVCGVANSLQQALSLFEEHRPDLSVVDIYLQGKREGIEFAEAMNADETTRHPFIFLTNATDRHTFEAARITSPLSYLLKPFNELELQYAIELAVEKFTRTDNGYFTVNTGPVSVLLGDVFFVKRGNILAKVMLNDIKYIEVDGKYCKIAYGNDRFLIQKSLRQLQEQLPLKQFIRVHRNYLVNVKEILKINLQEHELALQDGSSLAFSRRYLDELMQVYSVLK
jgi:DNA-binding LytR/AlgR family response regulator